MVGVFEVAQFSPKEMDAILAKFDAHELIGAAMQARAGDESSRVLRREAARRGSNDPVVLTGVATGLVRDLANQVPATINGGQGKVKGGGALG